MKVVTICNFLVEFVAVGFVQLPKLKAITPTNITDNQRLILLESVLYLGIIIPFS
jgi:hypothetical protein